MTSPDHRPLSRAPLEDLDGERDRETGGGIYLFEDEDSARAYVEEHTARLEGFGVKDIRARVFEVNESLTEMTRGPLGGA